MNPFAVLRARSSAEPRSGVGIWPASLLAHVTMLVVLGLLLVAGMGVALWFALSRPALTGPLPPAAGPVVAPSSAPAARPSTTTSRALTAVERLDSIKLVLGVIAGVGGVVALAVAYRKQRFGEDAAARERTAAYTDRMVKAVEQLGNDQAQVRVAGLYALAHLADDWADGRQMCIDVLCAYIRMPHEATASEREVRRTLFRIIRNHLRPSPLWGQVKWSECRFSFEGAVIDTGDLSEAELVGRGHMTFHGVRFVGRFYFDKIKLNTKRYGKVDKPARMWFTRATFEGSRTGFVEADFTGGSVDFGGARLLSGVSFRGLEGAASMKLDGETEYVAGAVEWGPVQPGPARRLRRPGLIRRAIRHLRSTVK